MLQVKAQHPVTDIVFQYCAFAGERERDTGVR